MIWSVVPIETLFATEHKETRAKEIMHNNKRLLVTELPSGQMNIDRLLSTDPCDFLDPSLAPGCIIDFYRR